MNLILPTVHVPHLASHALDLALRRVAADCERNYGYRPALVETVVELSWQARCYPGSGFVVLAETKGRGRQDRYTRRPETIKQVLVRPLGRHWREDLMRAAPPPWEEEDFDA